MKQPKGALELWEKVEEAAVKDPEAAGKMIIKIFEEIEKHTATDGGQKSKVLVSQKCDRWLEAFVAYWISSEDLSMPKKVIVLDALYRSPVSKWFSNMGLTIRSHMEIFSQFSGALEEKRRTTFFISMAPLRPRAVCRWEEIMSATTFTS